MNAQKTKENTENKQLQNKKQSQLSIILLWVAVIFCMVWIVLMQFEIQALQYRQKDQLQEATQEIRELKKVYIYDLEATLRGIRLDDFNREFEAKINILNDEVTAAQKKIASLQETKDKDDFSDMYLKSLKLKRDTMLQEYNRTIANLTEDINRTVAEIADEKDTAIIFDKRVTASLTKYVEDVTDEVIKRIKLKRPRILDE